MHAGRTLAGMTSMNAKSTSRWTLDSTGNRVLYAVVTAVLVYVLTSSVPAFLAVALLAFGALTFINALTQER